MDWDESAELKNEADSMEWLQRFLQCRKNGFTTWVSTFHKNNLPCLLGNELPDNDKRGSLNWTCVVQFTDGEKWMVRFPIGGKVKHSDEKVEIEVATMNLIREQTDIPVPEVKAWGLAAENKLGLGPFIITSFIEGVSLGDILCKSESRLIREDVDEGDIEKIYRQIAQIHLKLSKLNFSRIGSLSKSSNSKQIAQICSRPLTWKAHEILSVGGVDVFCSRTASFSSTTDYFKFVADQDLQHLYKQPNSVDDENDARKKYAYWNAFKALVPCLVSAEHESGPFKLICDDFGPANMIVDNAQNLKIVAVIDWEWTYAGPYQLFWSPPRWLLIQPPNSWEVSDERLSRYHRYLELYMRILGEEEVRVLGADINPEERPSKMMR
ncbi:hypothetical protein MMC29_000246 [Sticta canariensis]|nr:hypothetical protein [Sticta canariensis]